MSSKGVLEFRFAGSVAAAAACMCLVQCSATPPTGPPASTTSSVSTTSTTPMTSPPAPVPPPTTPSPAAVEPVTAAQLGATWKPGCPVVPEQLRRVDVNYLGFDGQT